MFQARFNFRKLQEDLGFGTAELPDLYEKLFGVKVSKATAYAWFQRGVMSVERFVQLLALIRLQDDRKIDVWKYVSVEDKDRPKGKRAA